MGLKDIERRANFLVANDLKRGEWGVVLDGEGPNLCAAPSRTTPHAPRRCVPGRDASAAHRIIEFRR